MNDNGNLTLEEAQFLYALLWGNGCVNDELLQIEDISSEHISLSCPSWDNNAVAPEGGKGSCTKLHRHKICVALLLAAQGEHIINIGPTRRPPDSVQVRRQELQELVQQKRQLMEDIEKKNKLREHLDNTIARLSK